MWLGTHDSGALLSLLSSGLLGTEHSTAAFRVPCEFGERTLPKVSLADVTRLIHSFDAQCITLVGCL